MGKYGRPIATSGTRACTDAKARSTLMDLGIHFANFTLPGGTAALRDTLGETAVVAEQGGCSVFTLMDHWFQMESFATAHDPMLEGYTSLGFLAGKTERMKLGLLVTGVTYRHPGLLAKIVTTLDVLSGGRAMLGIGAAWYEREHLGLGVRFPPISERFERLEEALQIIQQMWSADDGPYEGRHYQLAETICVPAPIQQPRPRILIGGGGERKTLRLVAKYADACNLSAANPEAVAHKLDVLRAHCADVGRDPSEIQTTLMSLEDPLADVDAFLAAMESYAALGVSLIEIVPMGDDPVAFVEGLATHIIPRLSSIGA
jgi:F420-dependent oxidoreductase-like protein